MTVRVGADEVSRSLVAHPATPTALPAVPRPRQVIEIDLRQQVGVDARREARAREAAARYAAHGTDLLAHVQAHGPVAEAGRTDTTDGWMLVGRWLTLVAVLSLLVVAFAV
ncbi:hypothetical protein KDN32_09590 [Nocardioides sp. J2M5]|uniref:hypothetical protein n=1 Tax=Nocardioides palaemonis TaxID=2829810 RepID=UPI001BACC904|nr:hypothetical protein [Nocardioides palaemonis]MBS2937992.1 hypothetical protein [Nocardioides palaemonis]